MCSSVRVHACIFARARPSVAIATPSTIVRESIDITT